jgi:hypothetical protein
MKHYLLRDPKRSKIIKQNILGKYMWPNNYSINTLEHVLFTKQRLRHVSVLMNYRTLHTDCMQIKTCCNRY